MTTHYNSYLYYICVCVCVCKDWNTWSTVNTSAETKLIKIEFEFVKRLVVIESI